MRKRACSRKISTKYYNEKSPAVWLSLLSRLSGNCGALKIFMVDFVSRCDLHVKHKGHWSIAFPFEPFGGWEWNPANLVNLYAMLILFG